MRICHVTSHLPPDQAANALLPLHLGQWAREAGDEPSYVAHPPRALGGAPGDALRRVERDLPGPVTWVEPRAARSHAPVAAQISSLLELWRIRRVALGALSSADIVHVHSNGMLPEASSLLASRLRKPVVLTLYGTEIWHYRRRRFAVDLFTRAYRTAAHVTFYSGFLRDRAVEFGLQRDGLSVVYPPVAGYFARRDEAARLAARAELGLHEANILVNVKRLHPLAGQRRLIDAMPGILRAHPDTRVVICGTGPLREELLARANELGVAGRLTMAGLVDNRTVARDLRRRRSVRAALRTGSAADGRYRSPRVRHAGGLDRQPGRRRTRAPLRRRRACRAESGAVGVRRGRRRFPLPAQADAAGH